MNEQKIEDKREGVSDFWSFSKIEEPKYSEIRVDQRNKNKISEIGIYIGLYLLAYLLVLMLCGGIQFFTECRGESLICGFDMTGFNAILTTTSYVLTPIVAIIGFLSWKRQHNKQTISQLSKETYELLSEQNLLAFYYSGYISSRYEDREVDNQPRYDLAHKMDTTFDKIRLICKITNNTRLEDLNKRNRVALMALMFHSDTLLGDGVSKVGVMSKLHSDYQNYTKVMGEIREELSDYILI